MSSQVIELRKQLAERWPDAQPLRHATVAGVPTGVAALDAILPGGGLPRGRLSVWEVGRAVGATAVLRAACGVVVGQGERAAWVDGAGVVLGEGWPEGGVLLRPAGVLEALVCAEELVRCGGFGLVVVTGIGRALAAEAVRLSRAAREGGSALVAVAPGDGVPVVGLRLASRLVADAVRWRRDPFGEPAEPGVVRLCVEATSLGLESRAEFTIPVVQHALRMSMEPGLVDRRGARRDRRARGGRSIGGERDDRSDDGSRDDRSERSDRDIRDDRDEGSDRNERDARDIRGEGSDRDERRVGAGGGGGGGGARSGRSARAWSDRGAVRWHRG